MDVLVDDLARGIHRTAASMQPVRGPFSQAHGAAVTGDAAVAAGPDHSIRVSVSSRVERATLKLRHTLALLVSPSGAAITWRR